MAVAAIVVSAVVGGPPAVDGSWPYMGIDVETGAVYQYRLKDGAIAIRVSHGALRLHTPGVYGLPGQRLVDVLGIRPAPRPVQLDTQAEMELEENILPAMLRAIRLP